MEKLVAPAERPRPVRAAIEGVGKGAYFPFLGRIRVTVRTVNSVVALSTRERRSLCTVAGRRPTRPKIREPS